MFFQIVLVNIVQWLSSDQACELAALTKGNIPRTDWKSILNSIYYADMWKNYQRETKLFAFSRDTNTKKLKIRRDNDTLW